MSKEYEKYTKEIQQNNLKKKMILVKNIRDI
ncbi:hypothetical protein DFH84_003169 [Clostridium saccharobutylicum]|nr:hypothetical protein [Clostridium saccharobutylicum]NOW11280.1 hypothetical protein [Clostridium saccharobutylicum]